MREAEENFKLEIRKLRGETGTDTIGVIIRPLLAVIVELLKLLKVTRAVQGVNATPLRANVGMAGLSAPGQGDRGGAAGGTPGLGGHGIQTPPGLDQRGGVFGAGVQVGGGESLKMQELPPLPAPGVEGASLAFGDWLALAGPQMSDIGAVLRQWWFYILQQVENFYEQWLMAGPGRETTPTTR